MFLKNFTLPGLFVCAFLLGACALPSFAQGDPELEDILEGFESEESSDESFLQDEILEGFDDETDTFQNETPELAKPSRFSLDGYVKLGTTYNFAHEAPNDGETDWRGFSRLRGELQLELSAKFSDSWQGFISGKGFYDSAYELNGRDDYHPDLLDRYEREAELREAYVQGSLTKNLDLKIGRQIVVWGKSDNLRVTDVLNPIDSREPGLTDIEDVRMPLTMSRLDYYIDNWNLSGIAIHEIRFNKTPEYGSDFFSATAPLPHEHIPSDSLENTEYALALNGNYSGWDISLYYAYIFHDAPHLEYTDSQKTHLELDHARLNMFGIAFNYVTGSWLLKTEAAYFDGLTYQDTHRDDTRTDALVGFEYAGFQQTTLSVEVANRFLSDADDEVQSAIRVSRTFWNETLNLTFVAGFYGLTGDDGGWQRFSFDYDMTDALDFTGGVVLYQSGDLPGFQGIEDNDRFFLELKYHF